MRQRLYLFVGYPGAGKTTVARLIHERTGAVHLWADYVRQTLFSTVTFSPAETAELYDYLNTQTDRLLAEGKSVIFDTNFNYHKDRMHLKSIADKHGAETIIIWMKTPLTTSKRRATKDANGQDTRLWGNMATADFQRISQKLEPPLPDEHAIIIDGTDIDTKAVIKQLDI